MNDTLPLHSTAAVTRRFRSSFTPEQIDILEQFFAHTPYPDVTTRGNLSQRLNTEENRIQIWFSNRRARTKKSTMATPPPSTMQEENEVPPVSPDIDIKSYPVNEHAFDPMMTSSPSMSECRHDQKSNYSSFSLL